VRGVVIAHGPRNMPRLRATLARVIEDFTETTFAHGGVERIVLRAGSGPGVVVMHEIPGATPEVLRFARRVRDAGFTVFVPHLFGTLGKPWSSLYNAAELARACVSREFSVFAANASSPIVDWLRALCRHVYAELGGRGVGAIGMCITGNFALALAVDPCVVAPVLSQPSLPFPLGRERRRGLHVSPEELATVKARDVCVLGMRFKRDPLVPKERFDRLREELGGRFEAIEIEGFGHSVVSFHLIDEEGQPTRAALERVLGFFTEHLK